MSATSRAEVLVTARELERIMTAGHEVVLLDVRWSLAEPDGHPYYAAGHIPGARYVDLDGDLAGRPSPAAGRHPLPTVDHLQQAARRWGINDGDTVIVYDDSAGTAAARAWWLLRWAGVAEVRILDGGLAAWNRIGAPLEDGDVAVVTDLGEVGEGRPLDRRELLVGPVGRAPGGLRSQVVDHHALEVAA